MADVKLKGEWKDHHTRELVNNLTKIARECHDHESLRDRISFAVAPLGALMAQHMRNLSGEDLFLSECKVLAKSNRIAAIKKYREKTGNDLQTSVEHLFGTGNASKVDDLAWAVSRWKAEVANRPMNNINRRTLDDAWRQVVRRLGGDPAILLGPSHDELRGMTSAE